MTPGYVSVYHEASQLKRWPVVTVVAAGGDTKPREQGRPLVCVVLFGGDLCRGRVYLKASAATAIS